MATLKLRRDDTVEVLVGKDKGKRGKVREVRPDERRVVVADVNIMKRHIKPGRSTARQAGIVDVEAPLNISNVAVVCTKCNRPTRVGTRVLDDGSKARFCKKCGELI
ncbi:MAG: 50S ribosomal protein L24 [Chloroflexi bacterium]|nr:50S ribosomal protein L24 [Chloroflexota bacterium]